MNKVMVAIGTVILVFGILLASFTFTSFPEKKIEDYPIPESTIVVDGFGLLMPDLGINPTANWADGFMFSAGETVNIQVNVTSGQKINFYVSDGSISVSSNVGSSPYLSYPNITVVNTDWVVPKNSTYNFVFSSSNSVPAKDVLWQIVKLWNETDYRTVTQNVPLLPFPILYAGIGIALSGLAITVYEISFKNRQFRRPFPTAVYDPSPLSMF